MYPLVKDLESVQIWLEKFSPISHFAHFNCILPTLPWYTESQGASALTPLSFQSNSYSVNLKTESWDTLEYLDRLLSEFGDIGPQTPVWWGCGLGPPSVSGHPPLLMRGTRWHTGQISHIYFVSTSPSSFFSHKKLSACLWPSKRGSKITRGFLSLFGYKF